ncbi:XynC protein [Vibrio albus]|uniref:XynC protein n=1 Tax=Vibrio albus TaxID=2200953 RepID=A0A2U3BCR0_9VIBR|nr:alpha/beta hydrolase family protein [Vibrio albus]PWI34579.1 XynC protein [Vibrio albus]
MKHSIIALLTMVFCSAANAYQAETITIDSNAIQKDHKAIVVLPDGYSQKRQYPVVYVLHGWSGNQTDWTKRTSIAEQADIHNVILVMPDGDYDKWYIDSPVLEGSNYQSYIAKDVVGYIDQHYSTKADRSYRAITGLSMGGYGALNISLMNTETFGNAGSISGGVNPANFSYNWGLEKVFGDPVQNKSFWERKAIKHSAHKFLSGINLALDCGTDDFFIEDNRELHSILNAYKVAHDYTERPGAHTWDYWNNAIAYQMLFFSSKFEQQ